MKELKCPKCGNVFTVDEADYASIVQQVKNAEFEEELSRRLQEKAETQRAEQALALKQQEENFRDQLNKKEQELTEKKTALGTLQLEKDNELALLRKQLKDLEERKQSDINLALAKKEQEIVLLRGQIANNSNAIALAVSEEQKKSLEVLQKKDSEISSLQLAVESSRRESQNQVALLKQQHQNELDAKQKEVEFYRDLKARMSTKMIGETLEVHCHNSFEQFLRPLMPNAYFEKDNQVVEGTKGDFVFRDTADGVEYISIMFEMKNEADETATKHTNEDFLKKLDEDRKKKNCEYAVLVSLLEPDNELYNNGIVDKSHRFPKMYVIRPQFFVPFITLLTQAAKKSLNYQKELVEMKQRDIDVTNFEDKLLEFKTKFGKNLSDAKNRYDDAIDKIDDSIKCLQKVKENLQLSMKHLDAANNKQEELTIKKLVRGNDTMKAKFDEAKKHAETVEEIE